MQRLHAAQLYARMLLIAHSGCVRVRGLLSRGRVSYVLDGAGSLDSHPSPPTWSGFCRFAERGHTPVPHVGVIAEWRDREWK